MANAGRTHRKRQRTLAQALGWGAAATLAAAIASFVALVLVPDSAVRRYWDLASNNTAISPDNPLLQQITSAVQREDALFVFPLALLCGGLAVGRLAPRGAADIRTALKAGTALGAAVVLGVLGLEWIGKLASQNGHLLPGQVDGRLILTSLACALGWTACSTLGTRLGLLWRDASARPKDATVAAVEP